MTYGANRFCFGCKILRKAKDTNMTNANNIKNEFITLVKDDLKIKKFFFNAIKDSKKLYNFNNDKGKMYHILRSVSFLDGNSNNYSEYNNNLLLLKEIQHYNISEYINDLEMDSIYQKLLFNKKNEIIFIKNDESLYGSNSRIIDGIINKNIGFKDKLCNYSEKDKLSENCSLVYIDDFVGTGETARTLLSGNYLSKTIFAYYIVESTKVELEKEGYHIIHFNFAKTVKNEIIELYKQKYLPPFNYSKKYNLNTLISENYNSPNNNFPWLFYCKKGNWNNFLDVRNIKGFQSGMANQNIKKTSEEKYFSQLYNNICETKLRESLSALKYETKDKRKKLFYEVIKKYDFDDPEKVYAESTNEAELLLYLEIRKIYDSFQENTVISNNLN